MRIRTITFPRQWGERVWKRAGPRKNNRILPSDSLTSQIGSAEGSHDFVQVIAPREMLYVRIAFFVFQ